MHIKRMPKIKGFEPKDGGAKKTEMAISRATTSATMIAMSNQNHPSHQQIQTSKWLSIFIQHVHVLGGKFE